MDRSGDLECTVGVIAVAKGILFFKNRDLSRKYLDRRLNTWESSPRLHTFRGVDLKRGRPQGVSIGVNRDGICVANTHVVSSRARTYDLLSEEILVHARRKKDVPRIVADFVGRGRVQGGRILVASRRWLFLVEVVENQFAVKEVIAPFVITNSFSLLSYPESKSKIRLESSDSRLKAAQRMIEGVSTVGALKSILRSHIPEKGELSICNHRNAGGGTESSHIIQIQGKAMFWWSCMGFPCENDYTAFPLFQDN